MNSSLILFIFISIFCVYQHLRIRSFEKKVQELHYEMSCNFFKYFDKLKKDQQHETWKLGKDIALIKAIAETTKQNSMQISNINEKLRDDYHGRNWFNERVIY